MSNNKGMINILNNNNTLRQYTTILPMSLFLYQFIAGYTLNLVDDDFKFKCTESVCRMAIRRNYERQSSNAHLQDSFLSFHSQGEF